MALLLGLLALGAALLMLRWYVQADTKQLKKSLRWSGVLIGALIVILLVATGRLGPALAMLTAFMAWVWRVFGWWQMARQMGGMFGGTAFGRGARGAQTSEVTSAFLRMQLDHATGNLDGTVVQGQFQGRALGGLSREELRALLTEVSSDPDSLSLLEAYMDRRWPEWRDGAGPRAQASPPSTVMDEAEALRILGLQPGASKADIKAAHRRLMTQLHPDRGGSDYLAAKVNAAKDLLLKKST